MTSPWDRLAEALSAAPDLPEALCAGRHVLFDGFDSESGETREDAAYRHAAAAALCRRCPELKPCREYSLSAFRYPLDAVVGGRVPKKHRPKHQEAS